MCHLLWFHCPNNDCVFPQPAIFLDLPPLVSGVEARCPTPCTPEDCDNEIVRVNGDIVWDICGHCRAQGKVPENWAPNASSTSPQSGSSQASSSSMEDVDTGPQVPEEQPMPMEDVVFTPAPASGQENPPTSTPPLTAEQWAAIEADLFGDMSGFQARTPPLVQSAYSASPRPNAAAAISFHAASPTTVNKALTGFLSHESGWVEEYSSEESSPRLHAPVPTELEHSAMPQTQVRTGVGMPEAQGLGIMTVPAPYSASQFIPPLQPQQQAPYRSHYEPWQPGFQPLQKHQLPPRQPPREATSDEVRGNLERFEIQRANLRKYVGMPEEEGKGKAKADDSLQSIQFLIPPPQPLPPTSWKYPKKQDPDTVKHVTSPQQPEDVESPPEVQRAQTPPHIQLTQPTPAPQTPPAAAASASARPFHPYPYPVAPHMLTPSTNTFKASTLSTPLPTWMTPDTDLLTTNNAQVIPAAWLNPALAAITASTRYESGLKIHLNARLFHPLIDESRGQYRQRQAKLRPQAKNEAFDREYRNWADKQVEDEWLPVADKKDMKAWRDRFASKAAQDKAGKETLKVPKETQKAPRRKR